MDPRLHPYVSLFKSALHRDDIFAQPVRMSRQLLELSKTNVPPQLTADHSAAHLLSFAGHVQSLIDKPCESLSFEGRKLYNVLGMLVLEKMPKGNFSALIWLKEPAWVGPGLQSFDPVLTPLLNFPTTNLWIQKFKATLAMEALSRIGDEERALVWAEWAWVYIELKVIRPINLNALRYAIRLGLELDSTTLRLVKLKRHYESIELITIGHYNEVQLEQSELLALEAQAPFLLPLWWGFRSVDFLPVFGEPVQRLKQSLIAIGGQPAQWRAIVNSGQIGINTYETLCKEFLVGNLHENTVQVASLLRTLGADRFPPIGLLRLILSLVGTKARPAKNYAIELSEVYKPLRHVLRLIHTQPELLEHAEFQAQAHAILRLIWDQKIKVLDRKQRQGGWAYLLQRATEYAQEKERFLSVTSLRWSSPIAQMEISGYWVSPLITGKALWNEAVVMKHCADLYGQACMLGKWLLFSIKLRGRSTATASYQKVDNKWHLVQVCAKANRQAPATVLGVVKILSDLINNPVEPSIDSRHEVYVSEKWGESRRPWKTGTYTSAIISADDQAPRINFSGHAYMKQLCGTYDGKNVQHKPKEST